MIRVNKRVVTTPPDIEAITKMLGIGRLELVSIAASVARSHRVKHSEALWMLHRGEVSVEEARESIIDKHRNKKLIKEAEAEVDDSPTQPE